MTDSPFKTSAGRRLSTVCFSAALALCVILPSQAAEPDVIKITVFDFELDDRSAGDGIVALDAGDLEYLAGAAEEARRLLAASDRYRLVDAGSAGEEIEAAGGLRHCTGCEGKLAESLGADQSLAGIITRITRTEYTLQLLVRDARTGEVLSNDFTGLRMGANYSWPRGVKSLLNKGLLAASSAQ